MCTALNYNSKHHYFGRNLDWETSYGEYVVITSKLFPVNFRKEKSVTSHYAIIGMGIICEDYPLYFDAVNEKGLCVAGLNFQGNAVYNTPVEGMYNITPFEFILWVLSKCETADEAKTLLLKTNIIDMQFNKDYPLTPMHWIISDREKSIVAEPVSQGLEIYDNPTGVLTNNPPFPMQYHNLNNYMSLSPSQPQNTFSKKLNLETYSRGMGALGLPGDYSSQSRFVRGVFVSHNMTKCDNEKDSVNQFFHMLSAVEQPNGCVITENGLEYSIYSSCMNADKGIYYYKNYEDNCIFKADMGEYDISSDKLIRADCKKAI